MMTVYRFIKQGARILEGYSKLLYDFITRNISKTAKKRYDICKDCEHNIKGICSQCGCIIKAKVRVDFELDKDGKSVDGCPERKW